MSKQEDRLLKDMVRALKVIIRNGSGIEAFLTIISVQIAVVTEFLTSITEHILHRFSNFSTACAVDTVLYPAPFSDTPAMEHVPASELISDP